MPRFFVAPAAQLDMEEVLEWTQNQWGEKARLRYEALLFRAILDVAMNPTLPGSSDRSEIAREARTYHTGNSRNRVAKKIGRVNKPRHLLLYRIRADGLVEIGRVLHESMDLVRHLPDEFA